MPNPSRIVESYEQTLTLCSDEEISDAAYISPLAKRYPPAARAALHRFAAIEAITSAMGLLRKLVVATFLACGITACVDGKAVGCSGVVAPKVVDQAEKAIIADLSKQLGAFHRCNFRLSHELMKSEQCGDIIKLTYRLKQPDDPNVSVLGGHTDFTIDLSTNSVTTRYLGE